jgi:acetyl esterase/lipase
MICPMKKIRFSLFILLLQSIYIMGHSQTIIPLYEGNIPHNKPHVPAEINRGNGSITGVTVPTLILYLPEKSDSFHTAVIICPGGGYSGLATGHEGHEIARELNKKGIAAFILKYRIPADSNMDHKEIVPLQDAERAIQLVRLHAKEWNINPEKTGIMGFSAGGHLASTLGTHFNQVEIDNQENINLRPDFMILCYPVISFADTLAHMGSRENLLGRNATAEQVKLYSNELQVTPQTPPAFIIHAADDRVVKVENSILFFEALQKNKVATEIHIYQRGGHGFGLHNVTTKENWFNSAINWLQSNQLMKGNLLQ